MKKIVPVIIAFILISCDASIVYKETIKGFPANRWAKEDIKTFTFTLNDDVEAGSIGLYFSHVFEPEYILVPLTINIEYPSGKSERIYMDINLKNDQTEDISDCTGDICSTETMVKQLKLVKGTYKITVQNRFSHAYLPNVLALGIKVKAIK